MEEKPHLRRVCLLSASKEICYIRLRGLLKGLKEIMVL